MEILLIDGHDIVDLNEYKGDVYCLHSNRLQKSLILDKMDDMKYSRIRELQEDADCCWLLHVKEGDE